jgi:HlyD family secretion protein
MIRRTIAIFITIFLVAGCAGLPGATTDGSAVGGDGGAGGGGQQVAQAPTSTAAPTAPVAARPTYLVQRGTVQEVLEFQGRWQPRDQLQLSFAIQGQVRRVEVRQGDTVIAGQVLADFQITELENQLATQRLQLETAQRQLETGSDTSVNSVVDAEVALANARLTLENTRNSVPWASLESSRLSLESAQQNVINAQRAYDNAVSRPAEYSAQQIEQAYQQLISAQNQLASSQASYYGTAQTVNNYRYQIAQNENAVIQAELALQRAREGGGGDPQLEQSVRSTQLQIDQLLAQIAQSTLYAPIDGEVLEVNIRPGDTANAFQTVITIGKPEPREAVASLAIGDAQRLSVGLVGVCQVINRPDTAVQCVVRRIPSNARDADQTTRVAASMDDFNLATGTLIEVDMPLQVRENVLWLPPQAIRTFQQRTYVVVSTPDGDRPVDVTLGLRTDDRVEIVSGVEEGTVVVAP